MVLNILRDRSSATGLSLLSGDPIQRVDDLPDFKIELHRFRGSDAAGAFVAGLEIAASRNTLAWTWDKGSDSEANKTVILARLDERRPDAVTVREALAEIRHDDSSYDQEAQRAAMARHWSRQQEDSQRADERTSELRKVAKAAGYSIHGYGQDWVRIGPALVSMTKDSLVVSMDDEHNDSTNEALRARYHEAAGDGFRYDPKELQFVSSPIRGEVEALAVIRAMEGAVARCAEIRKEAWRAAFVARMKMTGPRRRFLSAGCESGIHISTGPRNSFGAYAGGIKVGQAEFNDLVMVGWIERRGMKAVVTEAGMAAAGLPGADVGPRP